MESVLIVDDDADLRFNTSNMLKREGYETIAVSDGRAAIRALRKRSPQLVLLDIKLPDTDGMKILEEMKKIDKDLSIIMLTAYGDIQGAVSAMKLGAFDYVTKPFANEEILLVIKKALHTQYLSREVELLRKKLGEQPSYEQVMGESPAITHLLKQVRIVAPVGMTVILQGESGTGKELIAHIIHQESPRRDKPFLAIDCGALPETLIESELFGYEKGAFTGADDRKEGKCEQANEGTLFLDEVANLSEAAQAKLLRLLQERKLQRLGGRKTLRIDVRVIAATNTDLSAAVREGRFRADLFHRLNEFHIDLPPVRERREDILILANCFVDEANREFRKTIKGFSEDASDFLLAYDWPGNVRELRNTVRRGVLLCRSGCITASDITDKRMMKPEHIAPGMEKGLGDGLSFAEVTKRVETDLIKVALEKAGGNKAKAANILGMNRKALYRKMKSLSVPIKLSAVKISPTAA